MVRVGLGLYKYSIVMDGNIPPLTACNTDPVEDYTSWKFLLQSSVNFHNLQDPIVLEGGIISVPGRVGKHYKVKINGMVVAP